MKDWKQALSIPNILSYIRLLIIPVFVARYVRAQTQQEYVICALILLASGITDLLDGKIARKFHMVTELGKTLDPIADKLTQAAIVFSLMFRYRYMAVVTGILVVKELFMGINGIILLRRGAKLDGAMWFGKLSTAVFYLGSLALVALPTMPEWTANLLLGGMGACLLISFAGYLPMYVKMYRATGKRPPDEEG